MDRKIWFGKYKGEYIKKLILTHIGYIMWCKENVRNFVLTEDEQAIYDAEAIAIMKYRANMTFPLDLMCKHIKDKEKFKNMETPFIMIDGTIRYSKADEHHPIIQSILPFRDKEECNTSGNRLSLPDMLSGMHHSFWKEYDRAIENGEDIDDIVPSETEIMGW